MPCAGPEVPAFPAGFSGQVGADIQAPGTLHKTVLRHSPLSQRPREIDNILQHSAREIKNHEVRQQSDTAGGSPGQDENFKPGGICLGTEKGNEKTHQGDKEADRCHPDDKGDKPVYIVTEAGDVFSAHVLTGDFMVIIDRGIDIPRCQLPDDNTREQHHHDPTARR